MPSEKELSLSHSVATALLSYDPDTGVLRWKTDRGSMKCAGKRAGYLLSQGYRQITLQDRAFMAHRLAWLVSHGEWPSDEIDHINGKRDDNRLCNLRDATRKENAANRAQPKDRISPFKGVTWNAKRRKFVAQLYHGGKNRMLGRFQTAEEAYAAYTVEAAKVWGDFSPVSSRPDHPLSRELLKAGQQ